MTRLVPTPERNCAYCGKLLERKRYGGRLEDRSVFLRRKFCDQQCMAADFDRRPTVEEPGWTTGHYHARRLIAPGPCRRCGKPDGQDVHHIDGDYTNNEAGNLIRLCRSCHQLAHQHRKPCRICGEPQKGNGLCNKHWLRNRRWGDPMIVAGRVSAD